ncbi:hypothetical protein PIROE2DRAFT_18934 [Piromyces sp. E2]|nr:hypothetical protein PIROE2DRAFT_18934 [Piromyces sp. E2]|eukprot:OUM56461.1 hypothetical protein PIROE2DRAFT_18934 [Piromyces sp. E2]
MNKQLEDFKKFGFDSGMIDTVTLVGSAGSQSQTQLSNYNLNKSVLEKNIINYPPNQSSQRISVASLNSQPYTIDNPNISANNISKNYIKNVQEGQNSANLKANPPAKISNSNSDNKLPSIPNNQIVKNSFNNSMGSVNKVAPLINTKLNNNSQITNNSITKDNSNSENRNGESQPSSTKNNEPIIRHQKNPTNSSANPSIYAIRPKRDSSFIMNTSFSNINNVTNPPPSVPIKSSSESKRVSNGSYILDVLKEEDASKSQILETLKPQTQDSYLNQSDTLIENADKNSSFVMNTMEPIYSNELESLHDIESFEEYPSIHKVNQTNSILSSSTPSQPNSQPPPQQHNQLPKPPLPQRPKSYQQFNSIPYNPSLNSKKSPTTIDDYVPMTHSMNTPSSSQIARKSQRDSLLNQIFGTTNDNHSYVSMTALTDKGRRETYQSFDQLPLEDQHPAAENLSFTKMPNEINNEVPNESFSQTLCHDSYSQSYYKSNSHSNGKGGDDSILDTLSNANVPSYGTPGQIIPEKDLSHHSLTRSNHESSIFDKGANISKYSVKSLQLKNVPINNLDPTINERINSVTVKKFVNEGKEEITKENNFDILASSSMASGYNPKEKEIYQEPYYVNSSYYEKMPYYDKVEEYKEGMEEKDSVVSSLSISSSSSSLPHSSPSMDDRYHKKNSMEERTEHDSHTLPKHHSQSHEADISEPPADEEYLAEYYKAKEKRTEHEPEVGEGHHHHTNSNSYSLSHHSQNNSFSQHQYTPSPYEQHKDSFDSENRHHRTSQNSKRDNNHHYCISQAYDDFNNISEAILNSEEEEEEEERYYREDPVERYHHHSSISTTSSEEDIETQMPNNINYEREEDDYENQKPPVTVVTIPPLSPFELPAIAIPFNQPDPREVGTFSPIVTTQPTLTTKLSNYKMNNHLSIPYNRNYLNDYSYNTSNNNKSFNEQILNKRSHSAGGLAADDLYSPNYYPHNSQPYPSSHSSSQKNHWPSSETSYTSQLIQQRQQKNKNSLARRSVHSMTSNTSMHVKNKAYTDNSGLSNTGNISIHSNSNSNDTNPKSDNSNITNSQLIYYYVCKQQFIPKNENEIELNVGDVVEIMQLFDDGWRLGKNKTTNSIGIFPQECITMVSRNNKETPDSKIRMMEAKIEKLKDHKKMINYLECKLQDPNLSEKDRELYQQHLDYAYFSLEETSP